MRISIADFSEGTQYSRSQTVTEAVMESFASLSGDRHPLHTNTAFARSRGFADRVAYGNLLGLMISALVGMDLDCENALLISQRVTYRSPVIIGDTVTLHARIDSISEAVGVLELILQFRTQNRVEIASGRCQVKILPV